MSSDAQDLTEFFMEARLKPVAIALDCCLPLSIIFNEPEGNITREIIDIVSANKAGIYLGVQLQTVDSEIREVATYKMKVLYSLVVEALRRIDKKMKEGTRIYDAVSEEKQVLLANSQYHNFYSFLEKNGYGLLPLVEKKEQRNGFVQVITEISDRICRISNDILTRFHPVRDKDEVAQFISKEAKTVRVLEKKIPGIGPRDRGHIISCNLYTRSHKRKIVFITTDGPILKSRDTIVSIFANPNLRIVHPAELFEFRIESLI